MRQKRRIDSSTAQEHREGPVSGITAQDGDFDDAVLDEKLRAGAVEGLRVVDGSTIPAMVSANTNGLIMALEWRAASLILEGNIR